MSDQTVNETPPVAPTPPPAAGPYSGFVGDDGSFAADWADKLPEDLRPYAPSVATYKNLPELVKGHGELKKRLGAPGVKVPGEGATPEEVTAFRRAIGAPDTPDGYGLGKAPEGFQGEYDAETGQKLAGLLHKHHANPALAKELIALDLERAKVWQEASEREQAEYDSAESAKLTKAWGVDQDRGWEEAKKAAGAFGIDLDKATVADLAIGFRKAYAALAEDGSARKALGLTEDSLALMGNNPMTRAEDIQCNPENPLHAAYVDERHPNHQAVRSQVHRLLSGG